MIDSEAYFKLFSEKNSFWKDFNEQSIIDNVCAELGMKDSSKRMKALIFSKF